MVRLILFAVASAGLFAVSRKALLRPRSHGFARFFAWELILVLCLLNYPYWVDAPYSAIQITSWTLLLISVGLVLHGVHLLKTFGKADPNRHDPELFSFERTSRLVTVGVYKYIRHPMYSSMLCLAWGAYLKHLSPTSLALVLSATFFTCLTAACDEAECAQYFGDAYRDYKRGTKKFIPFVF